MQRRKYLKVIALLILLSSCEKKETVPDSPILLLKSVITADRAEEVQRITTEFRYNENNLLVERQRNDTTFFKSSNTFSFSQRKQTYTYNADNLLIKSKEEVVSLTEFGTTEANYSYKNEQLVAEKIGNITTKYTYDANGELQKVESIFPSGNVQEVSYVNNVPTVYQKEGDGYSYTRGSVKSYFNTDLQLVKREQTRNGQLIFVEERTYTPGKSYYNALATFKGFPYIKSEAYGAGISSTKLLYSVNNNQLTLVEEERFTPTFNANGYLIQNKGLDRFRLDTASPKTNIITYQYFYSR